MKIPYIKPNINFENYSLDMPIATTCSIGSRGYLNDLKDLGYFGEQDNCWDIITDEALDGRYGVDKVCYFSLAEMLFNS